VKAIILAGGAGTRLAQRLPQTAKAMAPIAGRPFLEYVLDRLVAGGIRDFIFALGYRAAAIREHFGGRYGEATIRYSIEEESLGTGGAVAQALRESDDELVLVHNGDSLVALDFSALLRWYGDDPADAGLVVAHTADASRFGAVRLDGDRIVGFAEKTADGEGWINAGIYLLRADLFARCRLSGRFSLERDLLQRHCATLRLRAFATRAFFIDIGTAEDYERANRLLPLAAAAASGGTLG